MYDEEEPTVRGPVHDLAAERAVLGAMLVSERAIDDVARRLLPEDFYRPVHETIYRAIRSVQADGTIPDPVSVAKYLQEQGTLIRVGGTPYLHDLMSEVPVVGNAAYYAGIVAERAWVRRYQQIAVELHQATEIDHPELREKRIAEIQHKLADNAPLRQAADLRVEWDGLIHADFQALEFLTNPLLQPGGQIALVGDGKSGKSLFCFEWAIRLSNGSPFLGHAPAQAVRVMYIDQENPQSEIQRRLWTIGADDPAVLRRLDYLSFPPFPPLNTPQGAAALLAEVDRYEPSVVFLDTISRMIVGEENDSTPWLDLYRYALVQLKARGVAVVRLDHFGKDRGKGSRGSSAKTQDIDHVWELSQIPGGRLMRLKRTYSRNGIGADEVTLVREGHPGERGTTTHRLGNAEAQQALHEQDQVIELALRLHHAGIGQTLGREKVRQAIGKLPQEQQFAFSNELLSKAQQLRKQRPELLGLVPDAGPAPGQDALIDLGDKPDGYAR